MNFSRIGQWAQVSEDGQYTVACTRVNDVYRFEAWHIGEKPAVALGVFPDANAARAACREHKERTP